MMAVWSVKRICLLEAFPINQFLQLLLPVTAETPEPQPGLAEQRWTKVGDVPR